MLRQAARPLEKGTRVSDHMTDSACDAKIARIPTKTDTCRRYAESVQARLKRNLQALIGRLRACEARPLSAPPTNSIAVLQGLVKVKWKCDRVIASCGSKEKLGHRNRLIRSSGRRSHRPLRWSWTTPRRA